MLERQESLETRFCRLLNRSLHSKTITKLTSLKNKQNNVWAKMFWSALTNNLWPKATFCLAVWLPKCVLKYHKVICFSKSSSFIVQHIVILRSYIKIAFSQNKIKYLCMISKTQSHRFWRQILVKDIFRQVNRVT